ncbi:MAG: hypothetical protein EZS28_018291 [Streblomastix strix]|uniref:Protein kinase domain-containing protein n=1 Tax=Streblomastix strix TaxID=222440 RepID=A0A5J4VUE9_9EUKA|nr:MAG: hypothetical protein EZS28_018291 [Streblomastix strix]
MYINSPHGGLHIGQQIAGKYIIEGVISTDRNAHVFIAKQKIGQPSILVLKLEIPGNNTLSNEILVLQSVRNTKHFTHIIEVGHHNQFNFLATQVLGPSFKDLALRKPPYKFSLLTLLKFALQSFQALQILHQAGFVHGAVKAKNFLIGYSKQTAGNFYLIGFSQCKHFNFQDTSRENQIFSPENDLMGIMRIMAEYCIGNEDERHLVDQPSSSASIIPPINHPTCIP